MSDPDLRVLRPQLEKALGNDPALIRAFERLFGLIADSPVVAGGNHSDLTLDDGTNPHGTTASDVGLSSSAIINIVYPVGVQYHQVATVDDDDPDVAMPSSEAPAMLFGGTWEKLYDTEGIDFHTEGYDGTGDGAGSNRSAAGVQADEMQGHFHNQAVENGNGDTVLTTAIAFPRNDSAGHSMGRTTWASTVNGNLIKAAIADGTNGTPRVGARTTDKNRWVRIWRRTA